MQPTPSTTSSPAKWCRFVDQLATIITWCTPVSVKPTSLRTENCYLVQVVARTEAEAKARKVAEMDCHVLTLRYPP